MIAATQPHSEGNPIFHLKSGEVKGQTTVLSDADRTLQQNIEDLFVVVNHEGVRNKGLRWLNDDALSLPANPIVNRFSETIGERLAVGILTGPEANAQRIEVVTKVYDDRKYLSDVVRTYNGGNPITVKDTMSDILRKCSNPEEFEGILRSLDIKEEYKEHLINNFNNGEGLVINCPKGNGEEVYGQYYVDKPTFGGCIPFGVIENGKVVASSRIILTELSPTGNPCADVHQELWNDAARALARQSAGEISQLAQMTQSQELAKGALGLLLRAMFDLTQETGMDTLTFNLDNGLWHMISYYIDPLITGGKDELDQCDPRDSQEIPYKSQFGPVIKLADSMHTLGSPTTPAITSIRKVKQIVGGQLPEINRRLKFFDERNLAEFCQVCNIPIQFKENGKVDLGNILKEVSRLTVAKRMILSTANNL